MGDFEHRIEWNPAKAATNQSKHGVSFDLAATVFLDPLARSIPDDDHDDFGSRWVTIGRAGDDRLLVVVHTWTDVSASSADVRIISARLPTTTETRIYEEDL